MGLFSLSIDFTLCLIGNMIRGIPTQNSWMGSCTETREFDSPKSEEKGTKRIATPKKKTDKTVKFLFWAGIIATQ